MSHVTETQANPYRTSSTARFTRYIFLFINLDLHSKVFDSDIIVDTMHSTQYILFVGSLSHLEKKVKQ